MASITPEQESLIQILQTPESYKSKIKPYRQAISRGEADKIDVVTTTVAFVIEERKGQKPMTNLNAIRLIKETLERKNQLMKEHVEEKILPKMLSIALFQKQNQSDDRGKTYFDDNPSNNLQVLGNSFFRLVLECILVWAQWFENSKYFDGYQDLISQNVKFPDVLNYFKEGSLNSSQIPNISQSSVRTHNTPSTQRQKFDLNDNNTSQISHQSIFEELSQIDRDSHKVALKSGSNFNKVNHNFKLGATKKVGATSTLLLSSHNKSQFGSQKSVRLPFKQGYQSQQVTNPQNLEIADHIDYPTEMKKLHNQIDSLVQDRDHYKNLYEHKQPQLERENNELLQKIKELEEKNFALQQKIDQQSIL